MLIKPNTLRKLKKTFKQASIGATIYQLEKNEFGEMEEEKIVTDIDGIFYEETTRVNLNITTNGTATTKSYQSLMVLKDDKSDLIKKHMICSIKGKRYEIIDVKNDGELDIYYILRLKRVDLVEN